NPGGSVKDRIGLAMVEAAEKDGRLKHGGTIVECTSGNTGLGLAMVAAIKGYRAAFCMPDKVSAEKVNLLRAFGAEVYLSPTAVAPEHPDSYYNVAKRIATERPGAVLMNQYHNPANPEAHYRSTGPELWEQTRGRITHFVGGMGAWVALEVAKRCGPNDLIVVLLPDTGERYLSKVHNDDWMRVNHLLDPSSVRAGNIAAGKNARVRTLFKVDAGEPLKRALALIQEHDVSQLPVFRGREVVGTLEEGDVLKSALADPSSLDRALDTIMGPPLPVVGADEPADVVTRLLASRNAAGLGK